MKNLTLFTVVFILICQTSKAQNFDGYKLIRKGDVIQMDTGVAIQINTYRIVRKKLNAASDYITSLNKTVDSLNLEIKFRKDLAAGQRAIIQTQQDNQKKNEKSFADLSDRFDKLALEVSRPKKFYQKPGFLIGAGAVGTIAVAAVLKSLSIF